MQTNHILAKNLYSIFGVYLDTPKHDYFKWVSTFSQEITQTLTSLIANVKIAEKSEIRAKNFYLKCQKAKLEKEKEFMIVFSKHLKGTL